MRLSVSCWLWSLLSTSLLCFALNEAKGLEGPNQQCFGPQCNQSNLRKKQREIETKAVGSTVSQKVTAVEPDWDIASKVKTEICVGSSCDLKFFERKKRAIVEAMVGLAHDLVKKEKKEAQGKNCGNSLCDQNNSGRKKRAVVKAMVNEAQSMTEEDLETELKQEVAVEAGNRNIFKSISAYLRGLFLLPDAQFNLRFLSGSPPPATKDTPVKILECSGPITSFCKNHHCRVKCIDGRKVELTCGSNSLDIQTTAGEENISSNKVACGQKY